MLYGVWKILAGHEASNAKEESDVTTGNFISDCLICIILAPSVGFIWDHRDLRIRLYQPLNREFGGICD